jgi:hypothetical protein
MLVKFPEYNLLSIPNKTMAGVLCAALSPRRACDNTIRFDISPYWFSTEEDWENKRAGRCVLLFRVSSVLIASLVGPDVNVTDVVENSVS